MCTYSQNPKQTNNTTFLELHVMSLISPVLFHIHISVSVWLPWIAQGERIYPPRASWVRDPGMNIEASHQYSDSSPRTAWHDLVFGGGFSWGTLQKCSQPQQVPGTMASVQPSSCRDTQPLTCINSTLLSKGLSRWKTRRKCSSSDKNLLASWRNRGSCQWQGPALPGGKVSWGLCWGQGLSYLRVGRPGYCLV